MSGALKGLRVLDLTDWRGVLTGRMLAIMGADVLQVEDAGGTNSRRMAPFDEDGGSLFWAAYGAGRRSLVLDRAAQLTQLLAKRQALRELGDEGRYRTGKRRDGADVLS